MLAVQVLLEASGGIGTPLFYLVAVDRERSVYCDWIWGHTNLYNWVIVPSRFQVGCIRLLASWKANCRSYQAYHHPSRGSSPACSSLRKSSNGVLDFRYSQPSGVHLSHNSRPIFLKGTKFPWYLLASVSRRCSLAYAGCQELSKFDEVEAIANVKGKPRLS